MIDDAKEPTDVREAGATEAKDEDNNPRVCPRSGLIEEEKVDTECVGQGVSCRQEKRICRGH